MSEVINGYELLEPFQNHNAGFSRWTFAKKNGRIFFLKEFMDPVYPDDVSLASALRQRRIEDCRVFSLNKRKLYGAINASSDGNVVRVCEFFRCNSRYYISNERIIGEDIAFEQIAREPLESRMILCRSLAHSIMLLHEQHIVHSDIKDTNVLLKRTGTGQLVGKLIDFDCSFFENDPPENEDDLGGDQVYLSPEACLFMCSEEVQLTCALDVFSLGLLFHQYLTGELPSFNRDEYDYAHEAVLDDQELYVSGELPGALGKMIRSMLAKDPRRRISMKEVFEILGKLLNVPGVTESPEERNSSSSKNAGENLSNDPGRFFKPAGDLM